MNTAEGPLVIVGAGLAGLRVAEAARAAGFANRILLVSDEPHAPYDRPPLSKAVLLAEGHEREIALAPGDSLAESQIELHTGRAVTAIDRTAHRVILAGGEALSYGTLVLATGSRVRTLPSLPPGAPGVHYLRSLDDALALRRDLAAASRVAIVGGGIIGLEIAAASSSGRQVTVIEPQPRVMARATAPAVSDYFERRHREAGVTFLFGATIADAARNEAGWTLRLSQGPDLIADIVVVGVGVLPNTELAAAAGLEVAPGGIVVDAHGRTGDPHIFAAGEVALHVNTRHGRHERQETWAHAAAHGAHVGRSLLAPDEGYAETASYWTDQYDINLQAWGTPIGETDIVRGDPAGGKFLVFHIVGGAIAGVSAVNAVRDLRTAKKLLGHPPPPDLANPAVPLKAPG
ncbi:MAG: FAD-dependent oxidoreductase [Alphaproteobacteria bacterium]|nr:FAD-dependent oxidoreductase [Alphaproteobacteria bacterium]